MAAHYISTPSLIPLPTKKKQDILGHSVTSVLRWMFARGWRTKDAQKVLLHYRIEVSQTAIDLTHKYPNQGKIAAVTMAQQKVLDAIKDGTTIPDLPKEMSLTDKLEALVQNVTTHYKLTATDPSLLVAATNAEAARVKVEAFLHLVTALKNDLEESLKTTGEYLDERIRKGE